MTDLNDISLELHQLLSSLKHSIDPSLASRRTKSFPISESAYVAGELERIRFEFYSRVRQIGSETTKEEFNNAVIHTNKEFELLGDDPRFISVASEYMFRLRTSPRAGKQYIVKSEPDLSNRISVLDAFHNIYNVFDRMINLSDIDILFLKDDPQVRMDLEFDPLVSQQDIQNLKRIIPSQRIAPVQFKIIDDKILVEDVSTHTKESDRDNTLIAKDEILRNGRKLIEQLQSSNCDRRLIENMENLHAQLEDSSNAIKIGISNISFGVMSQAFKAELPDAISAMLQSHNISINMYVAQFPDWNKFSENASLAEISREDIETIDNSVQHVIKYLENNPEIAEPRVVNTFRNLRRYTRNVGNSNKKAVFAVVRSIENLLSKTFQYAVKFIEETAKEVRKQTVKLVATSIISLGVLGATNLFPVALKIEELSWLKNAIEIVQKQIKLPKQIVK
jgi:hypothetical protein